LLTAIGATILETFSKLGIDNLTVPIGSAAIAYFLTQIFISS
ncbi:MAG: phosphatidate cytidylyltransferase, partial [Microcystis panniformis]